MANPGRALLALLILTACTPAPTSTPTPAPLRVSTSPNLEATVSDWISGFNAQAGFPLIQIELNPDTEVLASVEGGRSQLAIIAFQPPLDWFATPLMEEEIAVITHLSNPVRSITLDELLGLFSGEILSWRDLGWRDEPVLLAIPLRGDAVRERFESAVLGGAPPFSGANLAPTPALMTAWVMDNPGAIGFLPLSQVPRDVRQVEIRSGDDSSGGPTLDLALQFSLFAVAPRQPQGSVLAWLTWVQSVYGP